MKLEPKQAQDDFDAVFISLASIQDKIQIHRVKGLLCSDTMIIQNTLMPFLNAFINTELIFFHALLLSIAFSESA